MKEEKYYKGKCIDTIGGIYFIDNCNEDGTYTLRNFRTFQYKGKFTKEELDEMIMKQYCKYCDHAYCVGEDVIWCEISKSTSTKKQACRVNKCKYFEFNPGEIK